MNISEIKEKVLLALDEIRPFLASDGGDISLESIKDEKLNHFTIYNEPLVLYRDREGIVRCVKDVKIVYVKLHGACAGCSVNQMTLKTGVEMTIKKYVPQIEKVVGV